jgi:dihydropteroate synthase
VIGWPCWSWCSAAARRPSARRASSWPGDGRPGAGRSLLRPSWRGTSAVGVDPARIVIDAAHDFGKNSWQSLEFTRRLGKLTATGWPVLMSAWHKDFVGETLGADIENRLAGTLAVTSIAAWLGARVFREHNVTETRQALHVVATIKGDRIPSRTARGLA